MKIVEQLRFIEQISLVDALTNIANRRNFDNQMAKEYRRSFRERTPLSLLMIDADHFKKFNDAYGHQQGDVALRIIAEKIISALKRPGDFAARWGGEEFVALLPSTPPSGALLVAEHIRELVEKAVIPGVGNNASLSLTVSIGVATTTPSVDIVTVEELIRKADKALYSAKEAGRNRVCA